MDLHASRNEQTWSCELAIMTMRATSVNF